MTEAISERDVNRARIYHIDADGRFVRDLDVRALCEAPRDERTMLWVDIDGTNRHQHALLEKVFGFHQLAIEDTLNPKTRVKAEDYGDYLFVVIRVVKLIEHTPDPYDLDTFNLCFFIGKNFLVTVHSEQSPSVAEIADLVVRNPDVLKRGPGRIAHMIMDAAIDRYFPILDEIDGFVDKLEDRVFARFDETALHEIFSVKRMVLSLKRYLAPQREVFNILTNRPSAILTHENQIYFRDVYDHMLRINDSLDSYRELLSSTLDSYLTQVSNRLGTITKSLSVAATVSIPFVVVSGMWGMNFGRIPLSDHPLGFWFMLALQVAIGLGLLLVLRLKKLL